MSTTPNDGNDGPMRPFDEMLETDGTVRMAYAQFGEWLEGASKEFLTRKNDEADMMFRRLGITFTVYGDAAQTERMIPFDIIPRILDPQEWDYLARARYNVSMR